jgi:hypothetical protein
MPRLRGQPSTSQVFSLDAQLWITRSFFACLGAAYTIDNTMNGLGLLAEVGYRF